MSRTLLLSLLGFLTFSLSACAAETPALNWNDEALNWHSYEDGLRELNKTGENGIFIIYADWCPTCKMYSGLFADAKVINALQDVVLIRANQDLEPEVSELFNLDGEYIPRTFALDTNGKVIHDLSSSNPKWAYYIPPNDAEYLIQFSRLVKQHGLADNKYSVR